MAPRGSAGRSGADRGGERGAPLVAEQLRQVGAPVPAILLEPVGRNTAPAIAAAALQAMAGGADPLLLVLPSDYVVRDVAGFQRAVRERRPRRRPVRW